MRLIINGRKKLRGTIRVAGAKNAVLPILAATLLTEKRCVISNVPRIRDVETMMSILQSIGKKAAWLGSNVIEVSGSVHSLKNISPKLVKSIRASNLLVGPLLTRFHSLHIPEPGGCAIGNRPLDDHFHGFRRMGVSITRSRGMYTFSHRGLETKTIVFIAPSVTATENIIMAAAMANGTTLIKNAACEPHVQDLCYFLNAIGCRITGIGTSTLTIKGVRRATGASHAVIPDPIETVSFVIMGLATKSPIIISGIRPDHVDIPLEVLLHAGARFDMHRNSITLKQIGLLSAMNIQTRPYPGIPTDLQALFGVLATQANGTTSIHETIFDGRFGYIQELLLMGADGVVCDPHRALITGPTPLSGKEIRSLDLRAGMALIVAGLCASGQTIIHDAHIIDRGYERIDERLRALGADIMREE